MQSSRLSRNLERKTRNRLILNIIGIVLILILLIKFGIPFLINFSLFLAGGSKNPTTTTSQSSKSFIDAPMLTQSFSATNSATISVKGTATPNATIKLFLNDTMYDTTTVKADGTFSFDTVTLQNGNNTIKAKATKGTSDSDFSDIQTITYANKAPTLTVDSPSDGQSFSKDQNNIVIKGKTDTNVKVTINSFWAIIDGNGNYSYNLQLQNGDNHITVDAVDTAGNKTEKTLTVHYSQ